MTRMYSATLGHADVAALLDGQADAEIVDVAGQVVHAVGQMDELHQVWFSAIFSIERWM